MAILSVFRGEKAFGERTLFQNVTFQVEAGDKIGLVGINGCGKTTLLRILTGQDTLTSGEVTLSHTARRGYLEQHAFGDSSRTLWQETLQVFDSLLQTERRLQQMSEMLGTADEAALNAYTVLRESFEAAGGLYFRSRAKAALLGLGFAEADFDRPVSEFSGGQRSKAAMGRLLLSDTNLLLLDEPTNHLDTDAAEWLEEFLCGYGGALIVVSHDRYFLDRITNRTLELANGTVYHTNGNYTAHRQNREKETEVQAHHYQTAQREAKRLEQSIQTLKSFNREKSIRAAESKEKALERFRQTMEQAPPPPEKPMRLQFPVRLQSGNEVLEARHLSMGYSHPLFQNADLQLRRGERVFLLGGNGCGKTTLLHGLRGARTPLDGAVRIGAKVSIGYYDQTQQGLCPEKTVLDQVHDVYPHLTDTEIRHALAAFLFKGDEVFRPVKQLSGGEKARVLLLTLMLAGDNLLLLDEPTNHLDIQSREALEEALLGYDGTLLAVSHDRYFINRLATRTVMLTPDGIEHCGENYEQYLQRKTAQTPAAPAGEKKENTYLKRKQQAADLRKTAAQLRRVEQQIDQAETEHKELTAQLSEPNVAADYEQVSRLSDRLAALDTALEALMEQWEQLQSTLQKNS